MSAPYQYRVHGFRVDSEIALPELEPGDGAAQVLIRRGEIPERLGGSMSPGRDYAAAGGEYLLDIPDVARYWVRNGSDVVIATVPGARDDRVRTFVLSSVMAALAHQRGCLALHASAVDVAGRGVLFAGASGSGKSTLAAAFHDRGHAVIADDISVITFERDGTPVVHAGQRRVKLKADSLTRVGASLGARRDITDTLMKCAVQVPGPAPLAPLCLARIYSLAAGARPVAALTPVMGRAKVRALMRDTYRRRMLVALGRRDAHFAQCAALGHGVPVMRVERTARLEDLVHLVTLLEEDIRQSGAAG